MTSRLDATLDPATSYPNSSPAIYRGNRNLRKDPDVEASIGLHDMRAYPSAENISRHASGSHRQNAIRSQKSTVNSPDLHEQHLPDFSIYTAGMSGGRSCAYVRSTTKLQEPSMWRQLATVEEFRIDDEDGEMKVIPSQLTTLRGLRILSIRWSPLKFVGPEVAHLELTQLHLERNKLRNIDPVCNIKSLTILNVSSNLLEILPEKIGDLSYLRELDVSGNKLREIPASIGRLGLLRALVAPSNKLVSLPSSIGKLSNVEMLDVSGNRLRAIPQEIGSMASLVYLIASHNNLEMLPETIERCPKLETIFLRQNEFSEVPEVLGRIPNLKVVSLRENVLETMKEPMKKLKCLILDLNYFEEIPEAVFSCNQLELLSMMGNNIRIIPPEINQLSGLRRLYLHANEVEDIPTEVTELKELRHLLLEDNNIATIPSQIHTMKNLIQLRMDKAKLQAEWASVYGRGLVAIKNFAARLERGSVLLPGQKKETGSESWSGISEVGQELQGGNAGGYHRGSNSGLGRIPET